MRRLLESILLIIVITLLASFTNDTNEVVPMSSGTNYESISHNSLHDYVSYTYSDYNIFDVPKEIEVADMTGENPQNVNGKTGRFNGAEIDTAVEKSTTISTYGGCGPIAMIGICDYLSAVLGYAEIISNPYDYNIRIDFATKIFNEVPTMEVGMPGEKNTLILPGTYVESFNKLMKECGLADNIVAENHLNIVGSELDYLKESIDNGMPVTVYSGFINSSDFGEHYFVCYGYVDYVLFHKETKERLDKTFLLCHKNGNKSEIYCDANILNELQCGIICYDIKYNLTNIKASDFSEEFINHDTGLGQYFFDSREEMVNTSTGYSFNTNRLRCSYIENQYLVLSANRQGAGEAYLEFELDNAIRALELDMGLWSGMENFSSGDIIRIDYYDEGWQRHIIYDYNEMSTSKDLLEHYKIVFPQEVTKFRIYVKCNSLVSSDRNKGRLVIDNIILKEEAVHVHNYKYTPIDSKSHKRECIECGEIITGGHCILSSQSQNRYANCYYCKYLLDLSKDVALIIYG